ncbi:hypothetical protein HZI31_08040 [Serratia fonticola]|uniref:hypothetical protein n=1 Tax=Serratia fonticola TaxID=47917 RepID=UPI0015C68B03|nr:hypothetical protein [Serratia fonticola]NYA43252.1 hypothetical protein [Serratia fonticola]
MIKPKLKSGEYFNSLQDGLFNGDKLSEFEYRKILKDLIGENSPAAIGAIGFAHAIMGENDKAISWLQSFSPFSDFLVFRSYGILLRYFARNKELIKHTLDYSDTFSDVWLNWMSMEYYYTIGDIVSSAKKGREFLSMLPESKNKERAEYSISKQLDSLSLVYSSGHCTPEQLRIVSDLTLDILDKYCVPLKYVELFYWGEDGTSYEVGVGSLAKTDKTLFDLDDELLKRMIEIRELDSCEVTPTFSIGGLSNWRYIHGA